MGVVYHTNYIRWFEIGRTELLREIGFPYTMLEKIPILMPVALAHCEYKKPSCYDDLIEIVTRVEELGYVSMKVACDIYNKSTGELLCFGYTRHGFTDGALKPVSIKKVLPEFYQVLADAAKDE